ncbi:MAG: neutral/alkaline non-lysosomal ceramidase N-terminal domain-containing protein [Pirellulaceae bacterium]
MIRSTACLILALASVVAHGQTWQAASARVEITPKDFIWMAGYGGRNEPAQGKLTPIWAKALALRDANQKTAVLITLDLVGIHRDTSEKICSQIREKHGLERDQIAINCSHTHTGPVVGQNLAGLHYYLLPPEQQQAIDAYETSLVKDIVAIVDSAITNLQPSHLTWGNGHCTVAVNRRENVQSDVPELRNQGLLKGPSDHDVPVLLVRDATQNLTTIVFGYACHATTLSINEWSGDYPGFAQMELEQRYPNANAMFWAGCGADQNPLPRRTVELAESYGERLAGAVTEVVEGFVRPVAPKLTTHFAEIDLPLVDVPSLEAMQDLRGSTSNKYEQGRIDYLLSRLGDDKQIQTTYPYAVQAWGLGDDIRFVFLGGEVVVDYALRLKATATEAPDDQPSMIWVAGYSNDVMAYIPSRRVLNEGGYEGGGSNVYYGLPGLWSETIENTIANKVAGWIAKP